MYRISDQQIDYILSDIGARGVEMESLQQNLLDHVCCIIENNLEENGDFESFYKKTIQTFYKDELWEIEEETLLLLTYKNYYTMKKIMINSGIAAATFFIIGSFFKFMHWPGASLLILLGMAIGALVFLPLIFLFKKNETTESKGKIVLGIGVINGILFCAYSLFKVMHWPYASTLWFFTLGIFSFVFIPLYFFNGIKNEANKVNTITTTLILIIVAGVFFLQTSLKKQLRNLHETEINVRIENEKIIQADFEYVSKIIKDDSSFIKSDKRIKEIHSICEALKSELLEFDTGYKKFTPELKNKTITISSSQISSLWGGNFKEYENKISKLNNLLNEETIFELIERTRITKKDSESSSKSILFPSSILSPDPDFISYNNTIIGAYTEIQQIQLSTINNLIQLIELKEATKNNEKVNSN